MVRAGKHLFSDVRWWTIVQVGRFRLAPIHRRSVSASFCLDRLAVARQLGLQAEYGRCIFVDARAAWPQHGSIGERRDSSSLWPNENWNPRSISICNRWYRLGHSLSMPRANWIRICSDTIWLISPKKYCNTGSLVSIAKWWLLSIAKICTISGQINRFLRSCP